MEKAFEIKALVAQLEAKGLVVAEDLAKVLVGEVFEWTEKSLAIHESAMVKMLGLPLVQAVKPLVMEQVDRLDGQVG